MGTSATWARSTAHNDDQERQMEALVPSSSQMDPAHPDKCIFQAVPDGDQGVALNGEQKENF